MPTNPWNENKTGEAEVYAASDKNKAERCWAEKWGSIFLPTIFLPSKVLGLAQA
jgi:hypothetical protein